MQAAGHEQQGQGAAEAPADFGPGFDNDDDDYQGPEPMEPMEAAASEAATNQPIGVLN